MQEFLGLQANSTSHDSAEMMMAVGEMQCFFSVHKAFVALQVK
jgi:hypothetical protein